MRSIGTGMGMWVTLSISLVLPIDFVFGGGGGIWGSRSSGDVEYFDLSYSMNEETIFYPGQREFQLFKVIFVTKLFISSQRKLKKRRTQSNSSSLFLIYRLGLLGMGHKIRSLVNHLCPSLPFTFLPFHFFHFPFPFPRVNFRELDSWFVIVMMKVCSLFLLLGRAWRDTPGRPLSFQ